MNKSELVALLAEKADVTKKDAEKVLNSFVDVVGDALKKGDKIQMVGFGTFEARKRAARTGKNPQTKAVIEIPATTVPAFKAGKALKDVVSGK